MRGVFGRRGALPSAATLPDTTKPGGAGERPLTPGGVFAK